MSDEVGLSSPAQKETLSSRINVHFSKKLHTTKEKYLIGFATEVDMRIASLILNRFKTNVHRSPFIVAWYTKVIMIKYIYIYIELKKNNDFKSDVDEGKSCK